MMYTVRKNTVYLIYVSSFIVLSFVIFGCVGRASSEKAAFRINDYTLTPSEFNEIYAESGVLEDTPKAREKFMKNLIARKLLLQEAQRDGIDKQKDFLRTIENLWEQALLKIMIDRKAEELSSSISVTDQELMDFYDKWTQDHPGNSETFDKLREVIRWQILRKKQRSAFNAWIAKLKTEAKIKIDKKALGME